MKHIGDKKNLPKLFLLLAAATAMWFCDSFLSRAQVLMRSNPPESHGQPVRADPGIRYVGSSVCAQCHSTKASQRTTAMAKALESAADCEILLSRPRLTFLKGRYSYEIVREGDRSIYKVTDGAGAVSEPILWCFGRGGAGQTYVFKHNGVYYQSRVSFYNDIGGLDLTFGAPNADPQSIDEAAGAPMSADETRSCFACHSTAAISDGRLQLEHLSPGVSCEACHGPGEKHVAAMRARNLQEKHIFNPKTLSTEDMLNYCGSCHRTWEEVASMHLYNVNNVRFQPYRLTGSRCYDADDRRISCAACHNPHEDPKHETAFYDAKCVACHSSDAKAAEVGKRVAAACKVGKQRCVTCHMPKYEVPGSHFKFTDHQIRVVNARSPYPG